jgi:hypothetical protein
VPWKRIDGRRYWYEHRREGGRGASRYVGPEGSLAATLASERAAIRAEARETTRAARAAEAEVRRPEIERERELDELVAEARALAAATLEAAGYHRHDRGAWRKRREVHRGD